MIEMVAIPWPIYHLDSLFLSYYYDDMHLRPILFLRVRDQIRLIRLKGGGAYEGMKLGMSFSQSPERFREKTDIRR